MIISKIIYFRRKTFKTILEYPSKNFYSLILFLSHHWTDDTGFKQIFVDAVLYADTSSKLSRIILWMVYIGDTSLAIQICLDGESPLPRWSMLKKRYEKCMADNKTALGASESFVELL